MRVSKIGLWLAGVYLIVAIFILIRGLTCSGMFCGLSILIPIMPWPFLVEMLPTTFQNLFLDSTIGVFVLVFLNTIIVYLVGLGISSIISKNKNSPSQNIISNQ